MPGLCFEVTHFPRHLSKLGARLFWRGDGHCIRTGSLPRFLSPFFNSEFSLARHSETIQTCAAEIAGVLSCRLRWEQRISKVFTLCCAWTFCSSLWIFSAVLLQCSSYFHRFAMVLGWSCLSSPTTDPDRLARRACDLRSGCMVPESLGNIELSAGECSTPTTLCTKVFLCLRGH
mmetsp:Transcript_94843/g.217103  ORF Transcript_94843/g.217103 Transcript_94843/m.217103 type:complete len:175 (+) Transcript_94843:354-878(+)